MSGFSVSARHSFSGGCGNTLSITRVRVLSAGLLILPSFPKGLQDGQTGRARMHRSDAASPPSAPAHRAVRDSEFRVPRADAVPALPSSAPSGAWRQQAGTRPHSESMRGRSVRPGGSTPRKWPCESGRQEHGTRDWHWPASHTKERRNTISNCGLARYQLLRLRGRQRHDGRIRDELGLTQPEILRFSMSAQSLSHSSSSDR
jgi:hypothetical protein